MKVRINKNSILLLWLIIFVLSAVLLHAQQRKIDSLKRLISSAEIDTEKIILYGNLAGAYYDEKKLIPVFFRLNIRLH